MTYFLRVVCKNLHLLGNTKSVTRLKLLGHNLGANDTNMRIFEVLFSDGTERIMFGESRMHIRRRYAGVLKIEEIIIC